VRIFGGILGLTSTILGVVRANFAGDCADFGGFGPSTWMYLGFSGGVLNSINSCLGCDSLAFVFHWPCLLSVYIMCSMKIAEKNSEKPGALALLVPSATVFVSSFCIMVLEIVAARLIARHLGSSLYTWTAVIGVVLAGISFGNYLGGRIADRFQARKALGILFVVSSATCVLVVLLNNLIGEWILLYHLSWPARVFTHVFLVFIVPSTMLGTISPVVAKMALDRGLSTGRTVGNIYAWGAVGSIAGTFAAGYYLIALMGSIMIVWIVGGVLLLMGLFYCVRLWPVCLWAALFLSFMVLANAPVNWCRAAGAAMALRQKPNPQLIYEKETAYSYVTVRRQSTQPDKRVLMLDKLAHSKIVMDNITDLQYFYTRIYAAVTSALSAGKDKLSILVIGGGGYVYPRYVERTWPESLIEVVEIDPGITEAAIKAFGLESTTAIKTFNMDARNYVDELLKSDERRRYDFIYEDAVNDFSVPFQLITEQFNDKIAKLLSEDGVYMLTLIDIYDHGHFLGAVVNTLRRTFAEVYILMERTQPASVRNTFVVVAGKRKLDLETLVAKQSDFGNIWCLAEEEVEALVQKASGIILTDDYAPVENLLASVVRRSAKGFMAHRYFQQAQKLAQKGELEKSINYYKKAARAKPELTIDSYGEIGLLYAHFGEHSKAVEAFKKAVEHYEKTDSRRNIASIHFNLGLSLQKLGANEDAENSFQKAVEGFRQAIKIYPKSGELHAKLASVLIGLNDIDGAVRAFGMAIELSPDSVTHYTNLIDLLESRKQHDEAIDILDKLIDYMQGIGSNKSVEKLREYRELIEFRKWKESRNKP